MRRQTTVMADSTETITQDGAAPAGQKSRLLKTSGSEKSTDVPLRGRPCGDGESVLPDRGSPHTASALALPGCFSLLPSALQLEDRINQNYK